MCSAWDDPVLPRPGSPIRRSPDQSLLSGSPKLIAASHALRRLLVPRHPPHALSSLTIFATATQQKLQFLPVFSCQGTFPPGRGPGVESQAVTSREPLSWFPDTHCFADGGADRVRTDDLRRAKPALSQLSYSPLRRSPPSGFVVGLGRIELPTSPLSGVRSNRLSYRPLRSATPPSARVRPFAQRAGSLGPSELDSSGSGFAVVAVHGSAASNEGRALTWISPAFRRGISLERR